MKCTVILVENMLEVAALNCFLILSFYAPVTGLKRMQINIYVHDNFAMHVEDAITEALAL